jgi:hypothetical protein
MNGVNQKVADTTDKDDGRDRPQNKYWHTSSSQFSPRKQTPPALNRSRNREKAAMQRRYRIAPGTPLKPSRREKGTKGSTLRWVRWKISSNA